MEGTPLADRSTAPSAGRSTGPASRPPAGRTRLPAGLARMAPGPELATALASVDPAALPARDVPTLLAAWSRQHSHCAAGLLDAARECALADRSAPGGRREALDEFSADQARATLVLSRAGAWRQLGLAEDLAVRLPRVRADLWAGTIDEARARAFADVSGVLSDEHTETLVDRVLPEAPELTAWALRQRLERVAMALDPEWAQKRYAAASRQRRVSARRTDAGTANLSGLDLPMGGAVVAVARLETLAAAAKAAGHPGLMDTIRADLFLGLLTGRFAGWDDDDVVAALVADTRGSGDEPDGPPDDGDGSEDPDRGEPDPPTSGTPDGPRPDGPGPSGPEPGHGTPKRRRRPRRARIELRVGLTTLLGLDERPAELPTWGAVTARVARQLARTHVRGEWRVAVTGPDGALVSALVTRRRPTGWVAATSAPSTAIVEIHVDRSTLEALDPADHPAWAGLLADVRARWRSPLEASDPSARFPGEALARWVRTRDRQCIFPACPTPATAADLDHTVPHHRDGPTSDANLGAPCRHDHRLKHEGGWRLDQPRPGRFVWTSRAGTRHHVGPRRLAPDLPDPDPPPDHRRSPWRPMAYASDGPVWVSDLPPSRSSPGARPDTAAGASPARAGPGPDPPPF